MQPYPWQFEYITHLVEWLMLMPQKCKSNRFHPYLFKKDRRAILIRRMNLLLICFLVLGVVVNDLLCVFVRGFFVMAEFLAVRAFALC
jgi:hypothetical protein